jgi:uncharacterized membrane protein
MKSIRSYLIAGLVVWLPILVTFGVFSFIVDLLDKTIALLPASYQPEHFIGMNIPGFGVVISLFLLLITGIVATNILGQRLMALSESLLDRIPLVRTIYSSTKQVINAILSTNSQAFRKVLLIEYPRKGLWSIAFQTSVAGFLKSNETDEEMVSVFIPTTPNPTSGFLMMVPRSEVKEINMTIDEALKCVISLGVMQPKKRKEM